MAMNEDRFPPQLERLFASYRDTFSEVDASRNFMPGLWTKIEQRQKTTYSFRRLASGFVTAAAAICLVISVVLWNPAQLSPFYNSTYVDVLVDEGATVTELDQQAELR